MLNQLARLAIIFSGVLIIPILLIRAQPFDDRGMHRLLVPPQDCEKPCLLGIQPGITSVAQAQAILEGQANIAQVRREPGVIERYHIDWRCDDMPCACNAQLLLLTDQDRIINWLRIDDYCLRLGDVFPYLGKPVNVTYINRNDPTSQPVIFAYPRHHIVLYLPTFYCETEQTIFWKQSLSFGIIVSAADFSFVRWLGDTDRDQGMWHSTLRLDTNDWAYQLRRRRPKAWRSICE